MTWDCGTRVIRIAPILRWTGSTSVPPSPRVFLTEQTEKHDVDIGQSGRQADSEGSLGGISVRVFPVGRLDFDSEGLMLLTNHGDLAQTLLHPRYHVPKTYLIKVKQVVDG